MAKGAVSKMGEGRGTRFPVKRYLLDTGIVGDYMNRRNGVYGRAQAVAASGGRLGICAPVLGELWTGVFNSATRERNLALLKRHRNQFVVWPFEERAAEQFGKITAQLIRMGRAMQQVDVQIAAIAQCLGNCVVVSSDGDLRAVPDLDVEDWSQP